MMLFPKSGYILHFLHFKLGTDFTLFLFAQHNLLHKHERWITAQQSFFTSCHHLIQSHFSNWNPIEMMMVMVVVVASPPVVTLKLNASKQCISVRVPHTHFCTHTDHNLPLLPWNKQTLSCSVFQCSCTGKVALTTTATTTTTTVGCNTLYLVSTAETFKLSLCVCVWQFHCQLEQMLLPGQFPIWLADSVSQSPASIDPITHSCISFFLSFFPFAFFLHTSVSPFSWLSLYKGSVMVVVVVVVVFVKFWMVWLLPPPPTLPVPLYQQHKTQPPPPPQLIYVSQGHLRATKWWGWQWWGWWWWGTHC